MLRFENPLDPSKDGRNPFIDGVRYHIRNSESVKEEILSNLDYIIYKAKQFNIDNNIKILDLILSDYGYNDNDLTISDEHEILDEIQRRMSWIG